MLLALLAACSTAPPGPRAPRAEPAPAAPGSDGPGANPPPDLLRVPDAEPRVEPLRAGGPNKPYQVLGQDYEPVPHDAPVVERGLASWYGRKFHGRPTASGERYDMYAMTAAHKTMPIPSYARVRNPANGQEVVVRINDRGPFHAGRVIDLSYTAALKLGVLGGVAPVEVERLTHEAIRTGSWRRPADDPALAAAPQPLEGGRADPIAEIARRVAQQPDPAPAPAPTPAIAATAPPLAPGAPSPPSTTAAASGSSYWLQLGAFRQSAAADDLLRQVQAQARWLAELLVVFSDDSLHRLQAGPFASRDDASRMAERLRDGTGRAAAIVERR